MTIKAKLLLLSGFMLVRQKVEYIKSKFRPLTDAEISIIAIVVICWLLQVAAYLYGYQETVREMASYQVVYVLR